MSKNGKINLEQYDNQQFLLDKLEKKLVAPPTGTNNVEALNDTKALAIEKSKATLLKTQKENQLLDMRISKQQGEVIPVDLVQDLVKRLTKNFAVSFHTGVEGTLTLFASQYELSNATVASYRKRLKEIANNTSKEIIDLTKKEIDFMVSEYSDKRGVGQHD